jgi:hypothetical protein
MAGKVTTLLAVFVVAVATGPAQAASAPVVDRTFRCTLAPLYRGLGQLDVTAKPHGAHGRSPFTRDISTGYIGVGSGPAVGRESDLVNASSRLEVRTSNPPLPPGVFANARRCISARASFPLSAKGLPGPPVRFDTDADCEIRGRVLVRVRAVLEAPTSWRAAEPPYVGARRNVLAATIAVRSERTRRPIGLLTLDRAGETRLWAAPHCS